MAGATVGALLLGVVTVTSLRSFRQQLAYETWYFVHLLAYVGLALAFGHQLFLGGDLADDRLARWFWVGLHLAVVAALVWGRWGTTVRAAARPWHVRAVIPQGPGTSAVHLSGAGGASPAQPGQFYLLRVLRPGLWWHAHPYSLSAAPNASELRFSIKDRGDASHHLSRLPVGTKVAVEGPYGTCTPTLAHGRKVLFVVGGVGVAPARAMIERLDGDHEPVVLYRARSAVEATHLDELQALLPARRGRVLTLLGPSAALARKDPFGVASLRGAVPDIAERVAVVCGPESLVHAAPARAAGLRRGPVRHPLRAGLVVIACLYRAPDMHRWPVGPSRP